MEALRREEEQMESRRGVGKMAFDRWLKVRWGRRMGESEREREGERKWERERKKREMGVCRVLK